MIRLTRILLNHLCIVNIFMIRGQSLKNVIYKINVKNFEKHNKSLKKGHKSVLISTGFLTDAKMRTLSAGGKLLYLGLILRCGEVTSNYIECSHDVLLMLIGGKGYDIPMLLYKLEELQLITIEKSNSFMNRIEKKRKEKKRIERNYEQVQKVEVVDDKKPEKNDSVLNKKIREAYIESYEARYKIKPTFNPKVNSQIAQLAKRLGADTIEVVKFYLAHNDSFYLKTCHSIGPLLHNAESLHSQWQRGVTVTNTKIKQFEKSQTTANTLEQIEREWGK